MIWPIIKTALVITLLIVLGVRVAIGMVCRPIDPKQWQEW